MYSSRLTAYRFVPSLVLVLGFLFVSGVQAATITVCGSGCDQTTIAAAITAATAGDTIEIHEATHTEQAITISKNLTIEGKNSSGTTVQAHATRGSATNSVFIVSAGVTAIFRTLTIKHGKTATNGGGIQNNGTSTIENCTITANDAVRGGGIVNSSGGTLTVTNSTFSNNQATYGGGIYNFSTATINHSTITNNTATTNYGGGGLHKNVGTTTLRNTIIINNISTTTPSQSNCGKDCGSSGGVSSTSSGYNMRSASTDCNFTAATGDIDTTTPNLGTLAANGGPTQTHALLDSPTVSPAIDAGNSCPITDQRGYIRNDGNCDIGAFEYNAQPPTITVTAGTPQNALLSSAFTTALQATVRDSSSNPVIGVTVTFTAPSSGASGTFFGGGTTVPIVTDALGVATAPTFTANATAGSYTVTATVLGAVASADFSLTNNTAPVITEGASTSVNMSEDSSPTAFSLTLTATDVDLPANTLTWSISTNATNGTASASGTGGSKAISYTPTANYYGADSFVVKIADGKGGEDTITVDVTIASINDLPAITEGLSTPVSTNEDTAASLTLNATDVDLPANTLTWSISTNATNGTASASGTGNSKTISYTPTSDYVGTDSFVVQVSDGTASDTITVNVTISAVNDPPAITEGASTPVSMSEDGSSTAFSLTLNATDADSSDTLTWSISSPASHGTASASGTGNSKAISYIPTPDYAGTDSFVVQVSDGTASDTITVNVTISAVNDPPVITENSPVTVSMSKNGSPTAFLLTLHATDADGDPLTWNISTNATNGTAGVSGTPTGNSQAISYVPTADYTGADSFVVQVSDGTANATTTVNVTIADAIPPTFSVLPKADTVTQTGFNLVVQLSEAGKVYYVVLPAGAPAPTAAQVQAGQDSTGTAVKNGNFDVTTINTDTLSAVTGLTANTLYDVYVVAEDVLGNLQATPEKLSVQTLVIPDTTPPIFTATPTANTNVTQTSVDLVVQLNETGKAYYVVLPAGATVPTSAQIKAGQDSSGNSVRNGNSNVTTANTNTPTTITGLTANTAYDIYVVVEDGLGNLQTSPTKLSSVKTLTDNNNNNNNNSGTVTPPPPPLPEKKVNLVLSFAGHGTGKVTFQPKPLEAKMIGGSNSCESKASSCTYTYDRNTAVTLTALADKNSHFQNWSEACRGGQVVLSGEKTYCTAYFLLDESKLTVATAGTGKGTVTVNPTGISCGDHCTIYTNGTAVTLSVAPADDSVFSSWQGDCNANGQVTVDKDKTCTATFALRPLYQLTTTVSGNGTVSSTPAGINCGSTCNAGFYAGTAVTLTASPAADYQFQGWSDNCPNGQITLNTDQQCTATFVSTLPPPVPQTNTLTLLASGKGTVATTPVGTADCGANCQRYVTGTAITLTPTANDGAYFNRWIGPGCGEQLTLTADLQCEAVFTTLPMYPLNFGQMGAGRGEITLEPAGEKCGTQCANYLVGTVVTLTATPLDGAIFGGWQGDADCQDGQITLDSPKRCVATFGFMGILQFTTARASVSEDTDAATVTVSRLGGSIGAVSVNYSTAEGTAGSGDYTPTNGTLSWADGDASDKTFTVPILLDKETEADESVSLFLSNPTGGITLGAINTAELWITDVPWFSSLQFAQPSYSANEIAGAVNLLVTRAGGKQGAVSVDYAVSGGSALAGQDYTPISGTLNWVDGDRTHRVISLPILTDGWVDGDKTVEIALTNPQGDTILGETNRATVTILDTPPAGQVQFSMEEYQVAHGEVTAKVTVERVGGETGEITVAYATADLSAVANRDYAPTQGTLTWAAADVQPKLVVIPLLTSHFETEKILTLTLSNPKGGANLGVPTVATVKLAGTAENELTPGVIQFAQPQYDVSEAAGSVTLTVTRSGGQQGELSVLYHTQDGTAVAGHEYEAAQGQLQWADGEAGTKYLSLGIVNDLTLEDAKELTVELSDLAGKEVAVATVTITDDDTTLIQFTKDHYVVAANQAEIVLPVQKVGSAFGQISVTYATEEGTAKATQDYATTSGMLTWFQGDTEDKTVVIPLHYQPDTLSNKTFHVALDQIEGPAQLGEFKQVTITLTTEDLTGCRPAPVIDCYLINDTTLENVRVTTRGAIDGGQLNGHIQNEGLIQNVTLLEGTQIVGGRVSGSILGTMPVSTDSSDSRAHWNSSPANPVTLNAVAVDAHTTLDNVVIDKDSVVDNRAKFSQTVRFANNSLIPHQLELTSLLGQMPLTVLGQRAINVSTDVLVNNAEGGILTAVNGIAALRNYRLELTQNPLSGYVEVTAGEAHYAVLPTRVRQILTTQIEDQIPLGMTRKADGQVIFITHTGREVTTLPVVQAPATLRTALAQWGLPDVSVQAGGTLRVPTEKGYFSARPDVLATLITEDFAEGLYTRAQPTVKNGAEAFLVFIDETGQRRQQTLYSAPADLASLLALDAEAVFDLSGSVQLKIGEHTYQGVLDYLVTTASPGTTVKITAIEDRNGDGVADYQIHYPNGDQQVLFQLF